eukprot:3357028-Alexandrium_andersonii.AAC.1
MTVSWIPRASSSRPSSCRRVASLVTRPSTLKHHLAPGARPGTAAAASARRARKSCTTASW